MATVFHVESVLRGLTRALSWFVVASLMVTTTLIFSNFQPRK